MCSWTLARGSGASSARAGAARARALRIGAAAVATAAACLALASTGGTATADAATAESVPATLPAPANQAVFPLITDALENLALRRATIVFGERFETWSKKRVVRVARRVVKRWIKRKAKECPDPLPTFFFCRRPPESSWGRGVALAINGGRPGEFRSPWRPQDAAPRVLLPGFVFWLTCWSQGAEINNAVARSNLWYRLTNGLWVSDGWLDTGTNDPQRGVRNCPQTS